MVRSTFSTSALALLLLLSLAVFFEADVSEVDAAKDRSPPTGSIVINKGDEYTTSTSVTLTLTADDPESGVREVRYSNNGVWNKPWEKFSPTKAWTLTPGDGVKTVYYQIKNNDNVISITYSDTIILDASDDDHPTPSPVPTPTATPTPSPPPKPTPTPSPTPTTTPTPSPTPEPTPTPTPTPPVTPTPPPSPSPTPSPEPTPKAGLTVSLTVTPANSGIATRAFTVTAYDTGGSGIANVILYVDDQPVATWTAAGTYTYGDARYSPGTHTCYVEAFDNSGNRASETLEFSVSEMALFEATELWKLPGVILVIASSIALVYLFRKGKK